MSKYKFKVGETVKLNPNMDYTFINLLKDYLKSENGKKLQIITDIEKYSPSWCDSFRQYKYCYRINNHNSFPESYLLKEV